jgi:hypothetical protein
MANAVTTKVFELVKAFGEAVVDAKLAKELGDKARRRAIVGGNMAHLLDDEQLVGSTILEVLYSSKSHLLSSSGISHVLYAPSSTGKTAALMYFMKHYLETYNTPAIMVSGQFPGEVDYLTCMAAALDIPLKGKESCDFSWIRSLLVGLLQREGETLEHAPVLILDEFNSPGPNRENILFAESFARYVYGNRITVIFVTQNEDVARAVCLCNAWQKVGPFPGITIPDRISDPLPPKSYEWKNMKWSQFNLTQMIQKRPKYNGRFDDEGELDEQGNFVWLKDITNTTTAFLAADERLASKIPVKDGAVKFKDGFFDH